MSPLFHLPEAFLLGIYQEWIDICALGQLDTAVCSQTLRPQFLDTIKFGFYYINMNAPRKTAEVTPSHTMMLMWLVNRRLKARNWVLVGDQFPSLLMDLAEYTGGPQLRTVYLHGSKVEPAVVFCNICTRCPLVERIEIVNCDRWFTVSALRGKAQESLQELYIRCGKVKSTSTGAAFSRNCFPNLRVLHLSAHCDADMVASLLAATPNLRELRVDCLNTSDDCLASLRHKPQDLEVLVLRNGLGLRSVPMMRAVAERCTNLRRLGIEYSSAGSSLAAFHAFAEHNPHLEVLSVTGYHTDGLATQPPLAAKCTNLRSLTICCVAFMDDADELLAIAEHCRLLEELSLNNNNVVADLVVQLLASLPSLKELSLAGCRGLTDDVLYAVAQHQSSLVHLSLVSATGYTAAGANALCHALQGLRSLGIDCNNSILTSLQTEKWKGRLPGLVVSDRAYTSMYERFIKWERSV